MQGIALRIAFTVTCGLSYLLYGYDQGVYTPAYGLVEYCLQQHHS